MDPESVRAYMQQMKHETVEAKKDAALYRKQLASLRSLNESAAEVIRPLAICAVSWKGYADYGDTYIVHCTLTLGDLRIAASWLEKVTPR